MPRVTGASGRTLPTTFDELLRRHPLVAIHDEVAFENAQEMIDALTSRPKLTRGQEQYLDTLSILAEAYERERHPIDASDVGPLDVLRQLMAAHQMNASDLGRLLGERSLGPKILKGDRALSKSHIRTLADHFGLPADVFL